MPYPRVLLALQAIALGALAVPQASTSGSSSSAVDSATLVPSITISTSIASPTVPLSNVLPSQEALPAVQAWCPSEIFCAGQLLQTVNVAQVYSDPKTFVDKPTNKTPQVVLSDFNSLFSQNSSNLTENDIVSFVDNDFLGEGLELEAVALPNFNPSPPFLQNVTDPLVSAWVQIVHGYWTQLIRATNASTLCNGVECQSTLIPLNHTFVVPGGRFREQYYWDSFWIIEGLIQSQLFDIANATLQNFMDELERFGFIPNGGRIYYLNRSQPPLFIHMLSNYVNATNDISILERALPLAEVELSWWHNNRSKEVTSPFTNKTYSLYFYDVNNTAPRPESYLTDYQTVNGPTLNATLTNDEKADLYAELASGAETGWDYCSRFFKEPFNISGGLQSLNVRSTAPVDLNSILYNANNLLASLYTISSSSHNTTASSMASLHRSQAADLKAAILDLFWDGGKVAFYDFNLTSNSRNTLYTAATFYPLWAGIIPDQLASNETAAQLLFAPVNMVLNMYNGTFPTTFWYSTQQWDFPNAWPPHQYIAIQALQAIPSNISTLQYPTPSSGQTTFDLIPAGQLGVNQSQISGQPFLLGGNNATTDINALNGTVVNGGNATAGETWAETMRRELANRYITSALCSWYATGGDIPGFLPRLSDQELNVTGSVNNTGNMFEKFSILDVDSAGRGGEYTVQAGFGWTNGVVLWVASNYGQQLVAPQCPPLLISSNSSSGSSSNSNGTTNEALVSSSPSKLTMLVLLLVTTIFGSL